MKIRPVTPTEYSILTDWGKRFFGSEFALPYGWSGPAVGTAVAETDKIEAALTCSRSFYVGPLVHRLSRSFAPAIKLLDAEITAAAPVFGVQDAYLSAPVTMQSWHQVLRNLGWEEMSSDRKWFYKPLSPLPR